MHRIPGSWRCVARLALSLALALAVDATARAGGACAADIDGDGGVGPQDLAAVLSHWGGGGAGDVDGNGTVGASDLAVVLSSWGPCAVVPVWADPIELRPDPAVVADPALRAAIVATGLAWRVRDRASGIELLLVPPTAFMMGASAGDGFAFGDEYPCHQVVITHAYYLGRYEVTQGEFQGVMGYNPSYFSEASFAAGGGRPVESLSYAEINNFLNTTGLRLPTEAEWERACRAGTVEPNYAADGELLEDLAWFAPNSGYATSPVGLKAANPLGFHDMLGNVWEWVRDWYDSLYYAGSPTDDPRGPVVGLFHVIRGGSWYAPESNTRASFRGALWPETELADTGFRVAHTP